MDLSCILSTKGIPLEKLCFGSLREDRLSVAIFLCSGFWVRSLAYIFAFACLCARFLFFVYEISAMKWAFSKTTSEKAISRLYMFFAVFFIMRCK